MGRRAANGTAVALQSVAVPGRPRCAHQSQQATWFEPYALRATMAWRYGDAMQCVRADAVRSGPTGAAGSPLPQRGLRAQGRCEDALPRIASDSILL
jgi:hypothetical protein